MQDSTGLGERTNNTYLSIFGIQDLRGNLANSSHIYGALSVYQDTLSPTLVAFSFFSEIYSSVLSAKITLYFSKIMENSTFFCSDFVLQNSRGNAPTASVVLTDADCTIIPFIERRNITFYVAMSVFTSAGIIKAVRTALDRTCHANFFITMN